MPKEFGGGLPGREVDFPSLRDTIVVFRMIATPPQKRYSLWGLAGVIQLRILIWIDFSGLSSRPSQNTSNHKRPDK